MLKYRPLIYLMFAGLLLTSAVPTLAAPAPAKPSTLLNRPARKALFVPPKNDKRPAWTVGAGTRNGGNCPAPDGSLGSAKVGSAPRSLMAFVPPTQYGLTFAARPSLWIYVPETSAKQVVLSLKEDGITTHSQTFFSMPATSGIMALTPSVDAPPLETGKTYQWAAVLVCGDRPGPNDPAVTAWVQRIAAPETKPDRGTPLDQAARYGELGIWYDALTVLAQLRQSTSQNPPEQTEFQSIWTDFLKSGGIEALSTGTQQGYAFAPLNP